MKKIFLVAKKKFFFHETKKKLFENVIFHSRNPYQSLLSKYPLFTFSKVK